MWEYDFAQILSNRTDDEVCEVARELLCIAKAASLPKKRLKIDHLIEMAKTTNEFKPVVLRMLRHPDCKTLIRAFAKRFNSGSDKFRHFFNCKPRPGDRRKLRLLFELIVQNMLHLKVKSHEELQTMFCGFSVATGAENLTDNFEEYFDSIPCMQQLPRISFIRPGTRMIADLDDLKTLQYF
eukprot:TRINITY_DN16015_c0_g1_i1.p1 TRINITY_DN16015_c0_g1~~TRINITY_DN16015_c0_g1_i1.p1  ORF type:complete len:182 (-),score=8.72 TRINITY_DN16015_c0_g1_i1:463-1008(-)